MHDNGDEPIVGALGRAEEETFQKVQVLSYMTISHDTDHDVDEKKYMWDSPLYDSIKTNTFLFFFFFQGSRGGRGTNRAEPSKQPGLQLQLLEISVKHKNAM